MSVSRNRNRSKIIIAALLAATGVVIGLPKDLPKAPSLVSEAVAAEEPGETIQTIPISRPYAATANVMTTGPQFAN